MKLCEAFDTRAAAALLALRPTTAEEEVFLKTLAFFCTLVEKGCAFDACDDAVDFMGIQCNDFTDSDEESDTERNCRRQRHATKKCQGKMIIRYDKYNRPFVQ